MPALLNGWPGVWRWESDQGLNFSPFFFSHSSHNNFSFCLFVCSTQHLNIIPLFKQLYCFASLPLTAGFPFGTAIKNFVIRLVTGWLIRWWGTSCLTDLLMARWFNHKSAFWIQTSGSCCCQTVTCIYTLEQALALIQVYSTRKEKHASTQRPQIEKKAAVAKKTRLLNQT